MTRIKIAFYDMDEEYRERFVDYLMNDKGIEMQISVFSNIRGLGEAISEEEFQLVILGEGHEEAVDEESWNIPVLVLMDCTQAEMKKAKFMKDNQISYISKYQSMDKIIKQIKVTVEDLGVAYELETGKDSLEIVAVFSPVKHELQMPLSLLYAKNFGRERRVLYMNTGQFTGFSEILGETEHDMGDVILEIREGVVKREQLLTSIYDGEYFSYISPFVNPRNADELKGSDISQLVEAVVKYTDFKVLILDMGMNLNGFEEILPLCSRLYCIEKKGYLFEVQERQFHEYLEKIAKEDSLEKVRRIEIPGQIKVLSGGRNLLEQLDCGEFGDFVRTKM